jgi:hypothetical protein
MNQARFNFFQAVGFLANRGDLIDFDVLSLEQANSLLLADFPICIRGTSPGCGAHSDQ